MTQAPPTSGLSVPVRPDWLALHTEEALLPELPIIDAHHHLWDRPGDVYMAREFAADIRSGHRISASVYVDCRSMYREHGPADLRSVGEVEFAADVADDAERGVYGNTRLCAAIVSHVDLRLGDRVAPVLEAMAQAGRGRFRGIRQVSSWDSDERVARPMVSRPPGLLRDPAFRKGFRVLEKSGHRFDAFVFHPQLAEVGDLAATFTDISIILNHCGGPVGLGHYAEDREMSFADWKHAVGGLAKCPNIFVKISGLGMRMAGFDFHERPAPASSSQIAQAWRPYVETCIEAFGVRRCMFASNFSPDKGSCSYAVLWNAFKLICAGASQDEKAALFHDTAAQVYNISLPPSEAH